MFVIHTAYDFEIEQVAGYDFYNTMSPIEGERVISVSADDER